MRYPPQHNLQIGGAERRGQTRRAVLVRANVQIPDKATLEAHAVDVSDGGLGLLSPVAVELEQELIVDVPLEVCGEARRVTMTGKVRYCTKQVDGCYRVGMQFVHVDKQTAEFIAAICS